MHAFTFARGQHRAFTVGKTGREEFTSVARRPKSQGEIDRDLNSPCAREKLSERRFQKGKGVGDRDNRVAIHRNKIKLQ